MKQKTLARITFYVTICITLYILGMLLWDYFHGGVSGHNLLKREDLPYISNWWGAILLPLATYLLLKRVEKRIDFDSDFTNQKFTNQHLIPFLIAVLFAILIVVSSSTGYSIVSYYMFLSLFIVALFVPIYKSEYVLGFIIGLSFAFGGALPILIAAVLATLYYILFKYLRPLFIWIGRKIGIRKNNIRH